MKKRLLAMLLVLMLVVGLLPVGVLAADSTEQNAYVRFEYTSSDDWDAAGTSTGQVTVITQNSNGDRLGEPIVVNNYSKTIAYTDTSITLLQTSEYEIEKVEFSNGTSNILSSNATSTSFSWTFSGDAATIYVTLCDPYEEPYLPDGEIGYGIGGNNDGSFTRIYRIYEDQIYKMLHAAGVEVSTDTEIESIYPTWVQSFGANSNTGFSPADREVDYWHLTVTSNSADIDEVQPGNIRCITITYQGSDGINHQVSVYSGDLRYLIGTEGGLDHHYVIELNDDSFHIVYFYDEPGASVINNYQLYAIRFVEDGGNLVGDMPNDPTYPASSYFEFVAWTYDYNAGRPFLETTTVNEDTTVYSQKQTTTSNDSWIYVMNDNGLLKERIAELYNKSESEIDWDSIKISVYGEGEEHTNPDYYISESDRNGWNNNEHGYYMVYNYLTGVGAQENESIPTNSITKIVITADDTSGSPLGEITIARGIYDGQFWVSTGDINRHYVTWIYINDNGVEDPNQGGGEEPDTKPDAPDEDDINGLFEDKVVQVECVTENSGHSAETYPLLTGGYTIGDVEGNAENGYTVTVTVTPGVYVTRYSNNLNVVHTLVPDTTDKDFTLTHDDTEGWQLSDEEEVPVVFEVQCETEEPELEHVDVYAVKDRNYDTRVLIGSFMAPVGTNVIDFVEEQPLNEPEGFDKYEPENDGYYKDGLEYTFGENDTVSGWTNVYVNYIGKEQTVQVVIYRNGDTTTPYKTESIGPMRTGEPLDIEGLDINDYYQTQSGSIRFEFEGWYNDGGWNEYKKGNPYNTLGDSITINGWTNVIAMVWDVERVNVQAVVDDDKDAAETIFTGEARRGTNLIDYLNAHTSEMTDYDRVGYIRDQWYNWDWYGHKFADDSTVNGWTNVYVTYTSDWQTVQVVIYRNGDTTTPYDTIPLDNMRKGETLKIADLKDIREYYTPDKFATGFVYEGWFNDGAWNNYVNAGCPADAAGLDEIYINGWTNVIAMVWDQFPVYYNIVDENGTVVEEKIYTDTITERDLEDYTFYDASRTGYTFDGWYQDEKDVGDASKLLTGLNKAKKWELYGRYDPIPYNLVIYAAIDKDKDNAVEIYSGMVDYGTPLVEYLESLTLETDVFPGYSPEDGKWYKYDSLAWTFGESDTVAGWTNVLLNYVPNEYTLYYHGNGGVTESGAVQSTSTFKYGSEATIKNNPFTYEGYVFEGWALSADGEVVYTGSEEVQFTENNFPGLLENGKFDFYAVWAEDKLGGGDDGNEPDGTPDYRQVFVKYVAADGNGFVTPSFDTFNLEVDENGKVMTNVALSLKGEATPNADATFAYWTIDGLGYDGGAYSYEADLSGEDFTGYVAGETYTFTAYFNGPVVKPEQPNVYEIYVTVHNGTATFCGSEVTSHILAAENEDITITFTPDEGYTLDYATIDGNMLLIPDDGVYTLKQVDSDHTIEVFYESDKIGTEDPNEGDGVPDKYQATVNFVAGENGEVTGDVTKVYTIFGADGKYAEEGVITPSLEGVTVTPDEGYKVDGWTNAADERVNPESEITVEGGDVVVFTVNFQSDPSLKEITSFEKKLVTNRKTYHSFGLRVPTFIRNGSTVVVDEGKGVTLLYAISLTGTPGAEYAITDTGADVADGYALTGVIPETGVVTVYVTKDFTWREAAAAAYKDDALVNTAAVELTDNPNEPGQESTEEVDVVIDWDDPNVPVVPSDPDDDDDDEDEDDEVFVPNWLNTTDHYSYIVGYEDGTIRPGNNITRAEVATIFYRLLSEGSSERWYSASNSFSDVAADSWYNVPVSTLSNMGIIDGYEDGTFKPNASITRAEFTAIATRFFDYTAEYEGAFNDVTYSDWYADCVQAAVDMGLVNGYADGGFHPNAYITRAESCAIVNRVLNRVPHEDYLLDEDEMITWPDNRYGAWYYADMQEATNSHDYDWIRVSGEVVEEWTDKLAEPNW